MRPEPALVGISFAAVIAAVAIDGARRRETAVREEAETNFMMAQTAVEDYLTSVSENTLLKEQDSVDIRSLRQELLENALKYYQRFVKERSTDPLLRKQLANAYFRVAEITQDIEIRPRRSRRLGPPRRSGNRSLEADQGDLELEAECGQLPSGDRQTASGLEQPASRAAVVPQGTRHPGTAQGPATGRGALPGGLADCYSEIGIIEAALDTSDQGLDMLENARTIQQSLTARFPNEIDYQKSLIEKINIMGYVYSERHNDSGRASLVHRSPRSVPVPPPTDCGRPQTRQILGLDGAQPVQHRRDSVSEERA